MDFDFYKGKTVLVTGHTGFKGTWLTKILVNIGANVIGYSLCPNEEQKLFGLSKVESKIIHITGDILDYEYLNKIINKYQPEIIFHLAAQPLVLEGYSEPRNTYNTNVMGVVNLLDCVRECSSVKTVVNITTDKVYQNPENGNAFVETDPLNGYDPYSNSKSCSELITECYYRSFLKEKGVTVVTVRAGNVIGGGDFSKNRIIPDCVRAAMKKEAIVIRNPNSVRPFQHVLEALFAYLLVGSKKFDDIKNYNIGPQKRNHVKIEKLARIFCKKWGDINYIIEGNNCAPHEAGLLVLNCNKIRRELGWKPVWDINTTIEKVCEFHKSRNMSKEMDKEIDEYKFDFEKNFNK